MIGFNYLIIYHPFTHYLYCKFVTTNTDSRKKEP